MFKHFVILVFNSLLIFNAAFGQNHNKSIPNQDTTNNEIVYAQQLVDSILKVEQKNQDRFLKNVLINQEIQLRYFKLPVDRIIDYNSFEGVRIGFGISTNENISKILSLGGYVGYGFNDKDWKYSGDLTLLIHKNTESKFGFSYQNDIQERAGYKFIDNQNITSSESFRHFMVDDMDKFEEFRFSFSSIFYDNLQTKIFLNQITISSSDYFFTTNTVDSINNFNFSEVGIKLRYTPAYSQKPVYSPIISANFTKGNKWLNGEYNYTKIETKISNTIEIQGLGKTRLTLIGGIAWGDIPLVKLYNGHGSYQAFSLETENSFGTMRMGEFFADRFFSVFFKHQFEKSLLKTEIFSPKFALAHNYGIASLNNKDFHTTATPVQSFDKGFYEAGIVINDILKPSFIGFGFGLFYRYGPYAFVKTADNFSYKLSLSFEL